MSRKNLASVADQTDPVLSILEQLLQAVESLKVEADGLRTYSPAETAGFLGKTEYWVTEQIQLGTIPYTRIGKTPRLTADHIKQVQANGEVQPHKYSPRRLAA
ncbi:hypothetical protein ACIQMY_25565 [Streptomyces sp. NPDC091368]|uniref:hypothetical protein n=1 Tax=Streptomyces sp. NPDC091368 TaxID=3365993 RepID=UPI003801EA12